VDFSSQSEVNPLWAIAPFLYSYISTCQSECQVQGSDEKYGEIHQNGGDLPF